MRIWYVNHYASTPDQPTTGAYFLMDALARRGHDITIFASGFNYYRRKELRLQGKFLTRKEACGALAFQWIRTIPTSGRAATRMLNMLSFAFVTLLVGACSREKPDVVIGTCPHPFAGFAAWLLAKRHGAKFVYEIRDIWPESLTESGMLSPKSPIARVLLATQRLLYRQSAMVTSVLPHVDRYLESTGVAYRKFLWLPNGFTIDRAQLPAPSGGGQGVFRVMYLGGHSKYQGIDTILDAAQLLAKRAEIQIILVGDGSEKPRLVARAKDMGVRVEFRDAVPRSEVMNTALTADGFIYHLRPFPLLRFGLSPNKLCDYMLAGRPVVFAGQAGNDPVAECGCGISVPPDSPQAMADAIVKLYEMPAEARREMGARGQAYAVEHFDAEKLAATFDEALRAA